MAGRGGSRPHYALATYGRMSYVFFANHESLRGWHFSSVGTHRLLSLGLPFSSCLFLINASGSPRSAEAGGKAAMNSISYMKTEAALIYAKADENCRPP